MSNTSYLCSSACFLWGACAVTPFTASSSFLMAEAISLIVSRKLLRSPICSGTLDKTCNTTQKEITIMSNITSPGL